MKTVKKINFEDARFRCPVCSHVYDYSQLAFVEYEKGCDIDCRCCVGCAEKYIDSDLSNFDEFIAVENDLIN